MTGTPRPRVFVSSVMTGFEAQRAAARRGILSAGGEPVLVEDFPSLPVASRTACLDAVASSDVYLVIVGARGGWTTPSGSLVVEEEYEEARRRHLPVVYLRAEVQRDEDAQRLDHKLSDYVTGVYRRSYHTPEELEAQVEEALRPLLSEASSNGPTIANELQDRLHVTGGYNRGAYLQVVVAPLRGDEVFDVVSIGAAPFQRDVLGIGHTEAVNLFDFAIAKETDLDVGTDTLTIMQRAQGQVLRDVQVSITPGGVLDTKVSVSGQRGGTAHGFGHASVILEEDVGAAAERSLAFVRELYAFVDHYQRFARLVWGAALHHQGHQPLLREAPVGGYTMPMHVPRPAIAFSAPRQIVRQDLDEPTHIIDEMLTMLRRRFGDR